MNYLQICSLYIVVFFINVGVHNIPSFLNERRAPVYIMNTGVRRREEEEEEEEEVIKNDLRSEHE